MIGRCWTGFKWLSLLAVVVAVIGVQLFYLRVDEEIRARVELALAKAYPHLEIRVRSARLIEGEGIEIRQVVIRDPSMPPEVRELLNIQELFLSCGTDLQQLISGELLLREVTLRGPTIHLARLPDGRWNVDRLAPLPHLASGARAPVSARVENGSLVVVDHTKIPPTSLTFHNVQLSATPVDETLTLRDGPWVGAASLPPPPTHTHPPSPPERIGAGPGEWVRPPSYLPGDTGWQSSNLAVPQAVENSSGDRAGLAQEAIAHESIAAKGLGNASVTLNRGAAARDSLAADRPTQHTVTAHPEVDPFALSSRAPALPNDDAPHRLILSGSLTGDFLPRMTIRGEIDLRSLRWAVSGELASLDFGPELIAALPEPFGSRVCLCRTLRARANIDYRIEHDPTWLEPYRFEVLCRLFRGRAEDDRLPFELSDLEGDFTINNDGWVVRRLVARSGDAWFEVTGRREGLTSDAPCWIKLIARNAPIDQRLAACLPPEKQLLWRQFQPFGRIDAEIETTFDGRLWRPSGFVQIQEGAATYYKFPYRVERLHGRVTIRESTLLVDVRGTAGGELVRMEGSVVAPGPEADIDLYLRGERLQPDEKLLAALPETAGRAIRALQARGTFDMQARLRRQGGAGHPLEQFYRITLNRTSIQYQGFPYPLHNVSGVIEGVGRIWTDHGETVARQWDWRFLELSGVNKQGQVTGHGTYSAQEPTELRFSFRGSQIALDDELKHALRTHEQTVWDELRPQGSVDFTAEVRHQPGAPPAMTATVIPLEAAIEPRGFPYRLEKLTGEIRLESGRATLTGLRAKHGAVELAASGDCEFSQSGWRLRLRDLMIDRVRLERDRDLVQALPSKLRTAVAQLRLSGPLGLRGALELASFRPVHVANPAANANLPATAKLATNANPPINAYPETPANLTAKSVASPPPAPNPLGESASPSLEARWNLTLDMQRCACEAGLKLSNLYGSISLVGQSDQRGFQSQGEAKLDSADLKDFQVTQIRCPYFIDETRLVVGSAHAFDRRRAASEEGDDSRSLTAKVCGGTVAADGLVFLGPIPEFHLQARLIDGDLGRYAREMMPGRQKHLNGRASGVIELHGAGSHSLRGEGKVSLREADIYELPIMVSLLGLLSLRPPDSAAFTESDCEFRIVGDYVHFKQLDFRGDIVSLRGAGSMNFDGDLQLTFYAVIGRDDFRLPLVDKVIGRAAQQLLEVQVSGPLQNPETKRKLIPAVQNALGELQTPPAPPSRLIPLPVPAPLPRLRPR